MNLTDAVEQAQGCRKRGAETGIGDALITLLDFAERLIDACAGEQEDPEELGKALGRSAARIIKEARNAGIGKE